MSTNNGGQISTGNSEDFGKRWSAYAHVTSSGTYKARLAGPQLVAFEISTKLTMLSAVVGVGSSLEHACFMLGAKHAAGPMVLWLMWAVGALAGFSVLADWHSCPELVWLSTLMLPLPVVGFAVMSQQLVSLALKELELQVILTLFVLMTVAVWSLLQDHRFTFWACFLPSQMMSLLVDAYPAKFRHPFARLFFVGKLLVQLGWNALMIEGRIQVNSKASLTLGHVTISALPFTFTTSVTLVLFILRHLKLAFGDTDTFVIVKSPVVTWRQDVTPRYQHYAAVQTHDSK